MPGFFLQSMDELLKTFPMPYLVNKSLKEISVRGITYDSREVQHGYLFFALDGISVDGHKYIPDAIRKGASAIIGTQDIEIQDIPYIKVDDSRLAMAHLSAAFYRFPARRLRMVGITGTDGKTTTANMIYQIMLQASLPAGIISTVNAVIGDEVIDTGFHVTTPEAPDVQRYLNRMNAAGISHVVLETTSHGLAQERVAACDFDLAVVTNITHEHLDYHGSSEEYWEAKAKLFTELSESWKKPDVEHKIAILNRDDSSYEFLLEKTKEKIFTYGMHPEAHLRAEKIFYDPEGLHFAAIGPDFELQIDCNLTGLFNVSNCLAAIAAAVFGLGISPEHAQMGIKALKGIPGRMEVINLGQDFIAIVDFAHTPNALRRALEAAREITNGKVITLFGSAGLRDREKRSMMPEISVGLADMSILTAEDPRTESLEGILAQMAQAARSKGGKEGENFLRIADRGDAIRKALELARPGDVVITCGKGHEQSMCFGDTEYPWDERTAMQAALSEYLGIDGPEMPYLPTSAG